MTLDFVKCALGMRSINHQCHLLSTRQFLFKVFNPHLKLVILQSLEGDICIIRAICCYQTASFLKQSLKKSDDLYNTVTTSLQSTGSSISSAPLLIVYHAISLDYPSLPTIFPCFTYFNFHDSPITSINWLNFVHMVLRWHVNCCIYLISACFMKRLALLETNITCK